MRPQQSQKSGDEQNRSIFHHKSWRREFPDEEIEEMNEMINTTTLKRISFCEQTNCKMKFRKKRVQRGISVSERNQRTDTQ